MLITPRLCLCITAHLAICLSLPHTAFASENALNHYPIGATTLVAGILPPPGQTSLYNYTQLYRSTRLNDSDGSSIAPDFDLQVWAEALKLIHAWTPTFGPFFLASTLILPMTSVSIDAFDRHDTSTGLGDPAVGPIYIGYANPDKTLFGYLGVDIFAPLGKYNVNKLANNGINYWTIAPSLALTWVPNSRVEISGLAYFEFNTVNTKTNYLSGNTFIVDGNISHSPFRAIPRLKFAIQGFAFLQYSDDQSNGSSVPGGNRGRAFSLGPQISYDIVKGGGILIKYQKEFLAQNRPQGDKFWFEFAFPL